MLDDKKALDLFFYNNVFIHNYCSGGYCICADTDMADEYDNRSNRTGIHSIK